MVKLTKNELRAQQKRKAQLERYLPTLQLKKALLQAEVFQAQNEIMEHEEAMQKSYSAVEEYCSLFSTRISLDPIQIAKVSQIRKRYENIAGVEVPYFESLTFAQIDYALFDSPPWLDGAVIGLRSLTEAKIKVAIAAEKKAALEKELRLVSIRVNLFEKILIPRALKNIKKIRVFLGDQELAAVGRAKVAKDKIEQRMNA